MEIAIGMLDRKEIYVTCEPPYLCVILSRIYNGSHLFRNRMKVVMWDLEEKLDELSIRIILADHSYASGLKHLSSKLP